MEFLGGLIKGCSFEDHVSSPRILSPAFILLSNYSQNILPRIMSKLQAEPFNEGVFGWELALEAQSES